MVRRAFTVPDRIDSFAPVLRRAGTDKDCADSASVSPTRFPKPYRYKPGVFSGEGARADSHQPLAAGNGTCDADHVDSYADGFEISFARSQSPPPGDQPLTARINGAEVAASGCGGTAADVEDPAWIPYPRRARSISPRKAPSSDQKPRKKRLSPGGRDKRFQCLYSDSRLRQRRWQARCEERRQEEEDAVRKQLSQTRGSRPFDRGSFEEWYDWSMSRWSEGEQLRREIQRSQERRRTSEELAECSFVPEMATRPHSTHGGTCPSRGRAGAAVPVESARDLEAQQLADELVAAQAYHVEALSAWAARERDRHAAAEREAAAELSRELRESRGRIAQFAESEEGQEMLAERACEYVELNRGMDESAAMQEAHQDLVQATEAKLRQQAAAAFHARAKHDSQSLQLARLQVVRMLIQLQKKYEELVSAARAGHAPLPKALAQGFDQHLVAQIKQEPWYCEAREASDRALRAEAAAAAEAAAEGPPRGRAGRGGAVRPG